MTIRLRSPSQNDIPVYCPALTDGSIGDMIYFHSFRSPGFILDIVRDIRDLNEKARTSRKAGMIILGGGVCKHQVANAMLIVYPSFSVFDNSLINLSKRNGADFSVYIVRRVSYTLSQNDFNHYGGLEHWSRV